MILIDTSAWVEFLRDTGSSACEQVQLALSCEFATTDPIRMELLAGARDEHHLNQLRRLLARGTNLRTGPVDYDQAAALYRQCRIKGETVRKLMDCLIAAIAIRNDAPIVHRDADFEVLRKHTSLRTVAESSSDLGR
jgi:hypothetical protein